MSVWRILKEPDSLLARVFKSKYFPGTSIWRASPSLQKSGFWSSVLNVLPQMEASCHLQIAKGNSSIWSSPWFEDWREIYDHLLSHQCTDCHSTISDLWQQNSKCWDNQKISLHFDDHMMNKILQVPIINAEFDDELCWKHTPSGLCTAKSLYKTFLQEQANVATNTRQCLTAAEKEILMRTWKCPNIPPRVKTFAWRLIRRALASGSRASRFSTRIKKECTRCGLPETDIHLFFHCSFARAVWFSSPMGFKTDNFNLATLRMLFNPCLLVHILKLQFIMFLQSFGCFGNLVMISSSIKNVGQFRRFYVLPMLFFLQVKRSSKQCLLATHNLLQLR